MAEWFDSFPGFIQGIIVIAMVATVIMIIQIIMIFIGIGVGHDFDGTDVPDDMIGGDDPINDSGFIDVFGLKILTVRNLIAFFAIGGWSLICMYDITGSYAWSIVVGILVGIVTMFLLSWAMKAALKLQQDGTKDISNTIGKIGNVYLTIPANKAGFGKVNVLIQETIMEYDAMTEDDQSIVTGDDVVVCDVVNNYLMVKKNIKEKE